MKIAKKALAVVMALAMVACLSAMAFAATSATIVLEAGEVVDGEVSVDIVALNGAGLASLDAVIEYDANVLSVKGNPKNGAAIDAYNAMGETVMVAANKNEAGKVLLAIAFQEGLDDTAAFNEKAEDNEVTGVSYDAAKVVLCTLKFKVADGAADAKTTVKLSGGYSDTEKNKYDIAATSVDIALAAAPEESESDTEAAPSEEKPSEAVNPSDVTPTNPGTGDNDQKTGDNMALAAAGAVVVLAGAAFVISKKRK